MRDVGGVGWRQLGPLASRTPAKGLGALSAVSQVEPHLNLTSVPWVLTQMHRSYSKNMPTPFAAGELVEAMRSMRAGGAPGPDGVHPEFLLHAGGAATKWLCQYMSTCLEGCGVPKVWSLLGAWRTQGRPWGLRARLAVVHPVRLFWEMVRERVGPSLVPGWIVGGLASTGDDRP